MPETEPDLVETIETEPEGDVDVTNDPVEETDPEAETAGGTEP